MRTQDRVVRGYRTSCRVVLLAVTILAFGAARQSRLQARVEEPGTQVEVSRQMAHYIVFEKHADGTAVPVYYRLVELAGPLTTLTGSRMAGVLTSSPRNTEPIGVSLQNEAGQVVYQNAVQLSRWLRGEFRAETSPGATIDGHLIPLETVSFVVRVPQIPGTTLVLQNSSLEFIGRFDMQQLASQTPTIRLDTSIEVGSLGATGPASNREDLLIMGDGYTAAQESIFLSDAAWVGAEFFSISPYSVYRNYYNLHTLFTPSKQSGADHPRYDPACGTTDPSCCSDPAMQSDPLQGRNVWSDNPLGKELFRHEFTILPKATTRER
ncbi:MAG: M64 family metallopeptidase [Acidobacteriota bacterium]